MKFSIPVRITLGLVVVLAASTAHADPVKLGKLVSEVETGFSGLFANEMHILESAKTLFWSLATISLVWTMGLQIVRQDIGEAMMELLRFIVVTGTFYWLLINATEHAGGDGFVQRIVDSFYQMTNNDDSGVAFRAGGNDAVMRGLNIFLKVVEDTSTGDDGERVVTGIIAVMILVALTLLGAQFLLALILAWLLGYGGIFLLGFGGARWTSQIAINYYKHVVALGISILSLTIIGSVSENVFGRVSPAFGVRTVLKYSDLGTILAVSVLMLVLGLRVPQLLYTLVTGSSLGFFAGTAGMVGSAIATGGGAAIASASGRVRSGEGAGDISASATSIARSPSAVEAIERSAVSASGITDPFHAAGGSDPFGVPRGQDAQRAGGGGSVFGAPNGSSTMAAATTVLPGTTGNGEGSMPAVSAHASSGRNSSRSTSNDHERAVPPSSSSAGNSAGMTVSSSSPKAGSVNADGVSTRPDYLAEMSAITAARGDGPEREPTLDQTNPAHGHDAMVEESMPSRDDAVVHPSLATDAAHVDELANATARDSAAPTQQAVDSQSVTSADVAKTEGYSSTHAHIDEHALHGPTATSGTSVETSIAEEPQAPMPSGADRPQKGAGNESRAHVSPDAGEHRVEAVVQAMAQTHEADAPPGQLNGEEPHGSGLNVDSPTHVPASGVTQPIVVQTACGVDEPGAGTPHPSRDADPSALVGAERASTPSPDCESEIKPAEAIPSSTKSGDTDNNNP